MKPKKNQFLKSKNKIKQTPLTVHISKPTQRKTFQIDSKIQWFDCTGMNSKGRKNCKNQPISNIPTVGSNPHWYWCSESVMYKGWDKAK